MTVTQLSGGRLWDAEDIARSENLDASLKRNANRKLNAHAAVHTNTPLPSKTSKPVPRFLVSMVQQSSRA